MELLFSHDAVEVLRSDLAITVAVSPLNHFHEFFVSHSLPQLPRHLLRFLMVMCRHQTAWRPCRCLLASLCHSCALSSCPRTREVNRARAILVKVTGHLVLASTPKIALQTSIQLGRWSSSASNRSKASLISSILSETWASTPWRLNLLTQVELFLFLPFTDTNHQSPKFTWQFGALHKRIKSYL